mgnify:CR=1 FL=1
MTLSTLLSNRARKTPEKICIRFERRRLTYSEIDRLVTAVAGGLRGLGLNTKDRVAILMENCPEYIISYFAILRAGGISVPINTFLIAEEVSYILKDSGCKFLIYDDRFFSHIETIKTHIPEIKPLMFDEIPKIPLSGPLVKGEAGLDEDEVAVFLYTSGTTGFPKGVMLTHKNLLSNASSCMEVMDLSERDRVLLFLPLFHSFTFTVCVIVPIYAGCRIVLLRAVKPFSRIIKSILKDRITLFVAVPTIYNILAKKKMPFFLRYMFKYFLNIRVCVSGAAALPPRDTFCL